MKKLSFYQQPKDNFSFVKTILLFFIGFFITLFLISSLPQKKSVENPFVNESENGTKVVFVEFSDFECPYCAKIQPTISLLKSEYSGKIKFIFKHFPIHGESARKAAEAVECAKDQGVFEEYHLTLFRNQQKFSVNTLKSLAKGVVPDFEKFSFCLDSGEKARVVSEDFQLGNSLGVRATPTFFINGKKIEGAVDVSVFRKEINSSLVA